MGFLVRTHQRPELTMRMPLKSSTCDSLRNIPDLPLIFVIVEIKIEF